MGALAAGEWYVNFGWIGILGLNATSVFAIRRLNSFHDPRSKHYRPFAWAFGCGMILDYLWSGTFGTIVRFGFAAILFYSLRALVSLRNKQFAPVGAN